METEATILLCGGGCAPRVAFIRFILTMANRGHVGPYPPPVVKQPRHNSTIVMYKERIDNVRQVTNTRRARSWSTGICGCFEDMSSCLLVMFCMECYGFYLASKAGEACYLPCCLPGWLLPLRAYIRGKHQIEGSLIGDCCAVTCCYPCAMCQLSREIDNINDGFAPY